MRNLEKDFIKELKKNLSSSHIYSDRIFVGYGTREQENTFLNELHSKSGIINTWYKSNVLSNEIIKHIISDTIEDHLTSYAISDEGIVKELLVYPELRNTYRLSQTVLSQVKKLPHTYKYYLPLADYKEGINIKLTKNLSLKSTSIYTKTLSGYYVNILNNLMENPKIDFKKGKTLTIIGSSKGYISHNSYKLTQTVENSLYEIQLIVGLLFIFDILITNYKEPHYEQKSVLFSNYQNKEIVHIDIDLELSDFIHRSTINNAIERYESLVTMPSIGSFSIEEMFQPLKDFFESYNSTEKARKDLATKIGNSIIWYLYGISSKDSKRGIISLITSLEALIRTEGENNLNSGSIAEICSFLLSHNAKERSDIKERIVRIYSLRNSIAHSGKAKIYLKNKKEKLLTHDEVNSDVAFLPSKIKRMIQIEINKLK